MKSKIISTGAVALAGMAIVATAAPASAHGWRGNRVGVVPGPAGFAAGVVGGALAAATAPFWGVGYYDYYGGYYPGYAYAPGYVMPGYSYVAPYGYYAFDGDYGAYGGPWRYQGGPHPR